MPPLPSFVNCTRHSDSRASHVFRDIPHEVLNYRLDLGAVSYVPAIQLQARNREGHYPYLPLKHPLAKKREWTSPTRGNLRRAHRRIAFRRRVIELFARNRTVLNMPTECPLSRASSASCKWEWASPSCRACRRMGNRSWLMKEVKVRQLNLPRHVYLVCAAALPATRRTNSVS